jgi:hypothetical protein
MRTYMEGSTSEIAICTSPVLTDDIKTNKNHNAMYKVFFRS